MDFHEFDGVLDCHACCCLNSDLLFLSGSPFGRFLHRDHDVRACERVDRDMFAVRVLHVDLRRPQTSTSTSVSLDACTCVLDPFLSPSYMSL
jgi:hypothetical protein